MTADELLSLFRRALTEQLTLDAPLEALLTATSARATGLWRVRDDELVQVGFRGVPDMPLDVRTGFAAATARVPLSNAGLGIVKAVTGRQPAIATLEPGHTGLTGSASWLARFRAVQSVAFPIFDPEDAVTGVLAISTAIPVEPSDVTWQLMLALTAGIELP